MSFTFGRHFLVKATRLAEFILHVITINAVEKGFETFISELAISMLTCNCIAYGLYFPADSNDVNSCERISYLHLKID